MNFDNVYKILDFSREENLGAIKSWCLNFLKNKIETITVGGLVAFLNKQNNPEFAQENLELRYKALGIIVDNYLVLADSFYEDFLISCLSTETIGGLAKFLYGHNTHSKMHPSARAQLNIDHEMEMERERLKPVTVNLRPALLGFVQKNLKILHEKNITKEIPHTLFVDLLLNGAETSKITPQ